MVLIKGKQNEYISFKELTDKASLVTLNDSRGVMNRYSKQKRGILKGVKQVSEDLDDDAKNYIIKSMFNSYLTNEERVSGLNKKHNAPLDIAKAIYDKIGFNQDKTIKSFKSTGKQPLGKWDKHPKHYIGIEDAKYGTSIKCAYIQSLGLFLNVIDIDAHNSDDIPIEKVEQAIPLPYHKTRVHKTPSCGKHYYYLSKTPSKIRDCDAINIDYLTVKGAIKNDDETYSHESSGSLVIASFRWSFDGKVKEEYVLDESESHTKDILVVESCDEILEATYKNLYNMKLISKNLLNKCLDKEDDESPKIEDVKSSTDNAQDIHQNNDKTSQDDEVSFDASTIGLETNSKVEGNHSEVNLLNTDTGMELISNEIAKIINKTMDSGIHHKLIMALEGMLDYLEFSVNEREKILFSGLAKSDDNTQEHKNQIAKSLKTSKDDKNKIGAPYILKSAPKVNKQIRNIKNIKNVFWRSMDRTSYQLIKLPFMSLINMISPKLLKFYDKGNQHMDKDEYGRYMHNLNEIEDIISNLELYLETMGVGLNERILLMQEAYPLISKDHKNKFQKYVNKKLKDGDEDYGKSRIGIGLITNNKKNFGNDIGQIIGLENGEINSINKMLVKLEIQISLCEFKGRKYPMIQPLINLIERPKYLPEYKRQQSAYNFLVDNELFTKTKTDDYVFDSIKKNAYIKVSSRSLGDYLTMKYPILKTGIPKTELETIMGFSGEFSELEDNYYMFNNGVLLMEQREFIETNDFSKYFTTKKIDCNITFHKKTLEINPLKHAPVNLIDKTLREILIPNYKEGAKDLDIRYYIDFLERVGAMFNTRIKEKKFPCYYGVGDNGKDILIEILKRVLGDRFIIGTIEVVESTKTDFSDYDAIIFNELKKSSFKESIAYIKRISGGEGEGSAQKEYYSKEVYKPKNPSSIWLFTNEIPDVPFSDKAYYEREDLIPFSNRFIANPNEKMSNEFKANSSLKYQIQNCSQEDLEWIVNIGLQSYYSNFDEKGNFNGFTCGQTSQETKMKMLGTNIMAKFINDHYVEDEDKSQQISNKELCSNYKNYCEREGFTYNWGSMSIDMGNTINDLFGDIKKRTKDGVAYYIKPKSKKDFANDRNTLFLINKMETWETNVGNITPKYQNVCYGVYTRIKELEKSNTPINKDEIRMENPASNVDDILQELLNTKLITPTTLEDWEKDDEKFEVSIVK